ncbi:hypothetical protein C9J20_21500, partial [Photobacterium phosphoreum]|uniref:hypothetical protein n=1 Tax=Photobacterium phosphoreum TaxID=659 RepID=UPI000D4A6718
ASNSTPLSSNNNTTVNNIQNHQDVDKIEIHAQKDQSPKAIGLAVAAQLSDNRDGAMYDTLSSD